MANGKLIIELIYSQKKHRSIEINMIMLEK